MSRSALPLAFVTAVLGVAPAAAEEITQIVVEDNSKTTDATVRLIADVEVGDEWTPGLADEVKVRLVSSGLFKDVEVWWDAAPPAADGTGGGGIRLHLVAVDKHSWVIAPTLYNQPTNKGGGVGFGENNLFGENKKLLLYGQLATGDSFLVGAYVDPSIAGSRWHWQPDVFLKTSRVIEYGSPTAWRDDPTPLRESRLNYLNAGVRLGVDLWKFSLDGRLRGAHVSYGETRPAGPDVPIEAITGDPGSTTVPAPGGEGWDVSGEVSLTYDSRANWYGISTGDRFQLRYETALDTLGSDFDYRYATFAYERARKFYERHNVVLRSSFAIGDDLPFQQEFTTGGTSMRGWKNAQFRGDLKAALNVEYSVPLFSIKGLAVRGLGFVDAAYTTFRQADAVASDRHYLPDARARGLEPLKSSVGLGTRLYLRQVVLPLLGLDVGYGLERNAFEVYLAIGLTD